MGMDSVEILLCWEESLCIDVPDQLASEVTTPAQSIKLLSSLVNVREKNGICLNQRVFHHIRKILISEFNISRSRIKPSSRISSLFPKKGQRKSWSTFKHALGIDSLVVVIGFPLFGAGSTKIEDIVIELVARRASWFIDSEQCWTVSQLREVVRASVTYVVGVKEFLDDDHYVKDIGID